jgi:germination protein M
VSRRSIVAIVCGVAVVALSAWGLTVALDRIMRPTVAPTEQDPVAPTAPPAPERHITAVLFYGSADAQHLVAVKREVPFGDGPVEQGRQIVLSQLTMTPTAPLVSVIPTGATLRNFYMSDKGEAFVDLGPEIVAAHAGGSAAELLTVYALVNAVTANLPAVTRVQILVDGREVDTLAGHVDIRRPLRRNDSLVQESN